MPKLHEIEDHYTYEMIMDCVEMLDLKAALEEEAHTIQRQEMERKR